VALGACPLRILGSRKGVVFTEETKSSELFEAYRHASGDVDETMLDAPEDYVRRQKKRLGITPTKEAAN
jgi:hypothetical protein